MNDFLKKLYHSQRFRAVASPALFFGTLLLLDAALRLLHWNGERTSFFALIPWVFTLSWCLLLTAAPALLPRRGRQVAMGSVGTVCLLLYLTNAIMWRVKGNFFSFSSLMYAADGLKFLDASYLQLRKLVWIVLVLAFLGFTVAILLVPQRGSGRRGRIAALVLAVTGILCINLNREINLKNRQIQFNIFQNSLVYEEFSDPNNCMMLTGLYHYTFRDFCVSFGVYDKLDRMGSQEKIRELEAYYENREVDPDNDWTGRFAGKNLLLIQLEAIDSWMLNQEFMPNLYRVKEQSVDFVDHYAPLYSDAGTFNTEMVVNTGLIAPFVGATSTMHSRNAYPYSLANLMTEAGYTVNSFHRSSEVIYNRGKIHENWGYGHYHSGVEMGIPLEELDYDQALMTAYDSFVPESPFFSFLITYSGHGPYLDSNISARYYDMAAAKLPADTPEMIVHAMAHAWATDLFIGDLMERLERDGRLEDTVLVFYTDHFNYYVLDNQLVMDRKGVYEKNLLSQVPFFIYEKGTAPQQVEKVTSTVDVLPTLVNLFDLDYDGRAYVGNDAFSENGGCAVFKDYSWYDGETYWSSMAEETPSEVVQVRNREIKTQLEMSWTAIRTNYFEK